MPLELTVMTYNVHSCIGMDGKSSPARITEVVAGQAPDILALQELDSGLVRTGHVDQARIIAEQLDMHYHFHPAIRIEAGQYGNAILSRFPLRIFRAAELPTLPGRGIRERRGALWVKVDIGGMEMQVLNTHLGLNRGERLAQAASLMGPEWLGHPDCRPPVVFCGDLNVTPWSSVYWRFTGLLKDVQKLLDHRPGKTWPGIFPVMRYDYVLVSPDVGVKGAEVVKTPLSRVASDHLPLVATLRIPQ
jgi:endonuclease/exonuclease/phosphatase family metal-dependent hydrolase